MKRILPFVVVLATLLLSACGGAGQSPIKTVTSAPTATVVAQVAQAAPTATIAAPTPTPIPGGCQVVSLLPAADPIYPQVTDVDWQKGPKDAIVTILEYSDFQCPYCAQVSPVLDGLLAKYPQDFRLVYRQFPLNIHDKSVYAAQVAEAAGLQGKFWEMHDLLMNKQADWSTKTAADFATWVTTQAATISGLDVAKFSKDTISQPIVDKVKAELDSATQIGIDQTPFLILNGRAFGGQPDETTMGQIIALFKSVTTTIGPIRAPACPPMTIDAKKTYTATITTSKGDVTLKLFADKAPLAVNSFVYLARRGWFNNIPFHRVIADFVAQTGDPSGTGLGNPGYEFNNEISSDLKFDKAGMVGLANSGPNTNGSQWFITYAALPELDGNYPIFGQVTSGMDVVTQLTARDPQFGDTTSPQADSIIKVTIDEK
jgi:cyclophilin family peptidyl-prolyl cis-trans isomerase/protein-disulfide isomerase